MRQTPGDGECPKLAFHEDLFVTCQLGYQIGWLWEERWDWSVTQAFSQWKSENCPLLSKFCRFTVRDYLMEVQEKAGGLLSILQLCSVNLISVYIIVLVSFLAPSLSPFSLNYRGYMRPHDPKARSPGWCLSVWQQFCCTKQFSFTLMIRFLVHWHFYYEGVERMLVT